MVRGEDNVRRGEEKEKEAKGEEKEEIVW